jgi:hypothetical protein
VEGAEGMIFDGSPVSALYPGVTLFVGMERDVNDGSLRIYFGHRSKGIHTHAKGPEADELEQKLSGARGHVWVRDVDHSTLCDCPNVMPGWPA